MTKQRNEGMKKKYTPVLFLGNILHSTCGYFSFYQAAMSPPIRDCVISDF